MLHSLLATLEVDADVYCLLTSSTACLLSSHFVTATLSVLRLVWP